MQFPKKTKTAAILTQKGLQPFYFYGGCFLVEKLLFCSSFLCCIRAKKSTKVALLFLCSAVKGEHIFCQPPALLLPQKRAKNAVFVQSAKDPQLFSKVGGLFPFLFV